MNFFNGTKSNTIIATTASIIATIKINTKQYLNGVTPIGHGQRNTGVTYNQINGKTYTVYTFYGGTTGSIELSTGQPTNVYVLAVGGGAASNNNLAGNGSGGGGGGGVVFNSYSITANETINVNVADKAVAIRETVVNGSNTTVSFLNNTSYNLTAYGGGSGNYGTLNGTNGSSGGGGGRGISATSGGTGNRQPGTTTAITGSVQGYNGGGSTNYTGGGGGGAGGAGTQGNSTVGSGAGGIGRNCTLPGINPNNYYGGGGSGGGFDKKPGNGGLGGGGGSAMYGAIGSNGGLGGTGTYTNADGDSSLWSDQQGCNGGSNTGGGGGGSRQAIGGNGGSGVVVIAVEEGFVENLVTETFIGLQPSYWFKMMTTDVSGTTLKNSGTVNTNQYTATLLNGITIKTDTTVAGSLYIPPTNALTAANYPTIQLPTMNFSSGSLSFSFWYFRNSGWGIGTKPHIIYIKSSTYYIYVLGGGDWSPETGNRAVACYLFNTAGSQYNGMFQITNILDKWMHICFVLTQGSSNVKMYLNKQLITAPSLQQTNITIPSLSGSYTTNNIGNNPLYTGTISNPTKGEGYIRDVRFFDKTLSQAEINGLY